MLNDGFIFEAPKISRYGLHNKTQIKQLQPYKAHWWLCQKNKQTQIASKNNPKWNKFALWMTLQSLLQQLLWEEATSVGTTNMDIFQGSWKANYNFYKIDNSTNNHKPEVVGGETNQL